MGQVNGRALAICAAIGTLIFLASFHPEVLDPGNVHWLLQYDWGASFVGWEAYRHDSWRLPLGAEKLLDWPTGDNIVFTDSLPVLAILFKILSPILPDPFQYVGWWFLTSLILQVYFGYRLASKAGLDALPALICAGLIGLTPFYLARLYHNTLFSHWMILWALEIYGFEKRAKRRQWGFGFLLALTSLTNFYLTFMIAGVFAADVLRARLRRREAGSAQPPAEGSEATTVAPLIIAMGLVGYFGVRQSAAGGFGVYAAELLAWINPQSPIYSRFLPALPAWEGAQEGFQYLGLGVIVLILVGLTVYARRLLTRAGPLPAVEARFDGAVYLAPVMATFFVFSLSDKIHFGGRVALDLHYGPLLGPVTAMLRSSGRFLWPVSYALLLSAILAVAKLPRRWILAVLLAALTLQIADLSAFLQRQRQFTEAAVTRTGFQRLKSPQWDRLIRAARVVDFQPSDPMSRLDLFWELAFRSVKLGVPVTTMYSSREAPVQFAFHREDDVAVREGRLAPDRLYVLADDCAPFSGAAVYRLDGVMIIPPAGADVSGLTPATAPPLTVFDARIALSQPTSRRLLGSGWRTPEGSGVMSDGAEATLHLPLPQGESGPLLFSVEARGPAAGSWDLEAVSGDTTLVRQPAQAKDAFVFRVPSSRVAGRSALTVTLHSIVPGGGAVKQPNGPDFLLVSARLSHADGAP